MFVSPHQKHVILFFLGKNRKPQLWGKGFANCLLFGHRGEGVVNEERVSVFAARNSNVDTFAAMGR